MQKRQSMIRVIGALAAAAACAAILDAAVVLADDKPTTQPAVPTTAPAMAAAPTTGPALVGGTISSDYARTPARPTQTATLQSAANGGGSVVGTPATVKVGAGVDPVQSDANVTASTPGATTAGGATTRDSVQTQR